MRTDILGVAIACALASAAASGRAADAASAWTHGKAIRESLERLPEDGLKALYLQCASESSRRLMAFEEAARCSIAAEALKQRAFGGDFGALLEWWRRHRDAPIEAAAPAVPRSR